MALSSKFKEDNPLKKKEKDNICFDVDISVQKNSGNVTGVHIENLFMEQKTENHDTTVLKNPVKINMIFGTAAGSYEEIQKAEIKDNPMIIFFLSNRGRPLQKLRGPFTLNEKEEQVLLFPCDWIELEYGGFKQISAKDLDLLNRYRNFWFENPEGDKFLVPEEAYHRVKEEIAEFRAKNIHEHSEVKARVSFNLSHVLTILQTLVRHRDFNISFKDGYLFLNGDHPIEPSYPFSDTGIKDRINLLVKHAGFASVQHMALVQSWVILLLTKETVSSRELTEAGKKAAFGYLPGLAPSFQKSVFAESDMWYQFHPHKGQTQPH